MDFKVDYMKIYDIGEALERENEELKQTLKTMVYIVKELSESWKGTDFDSFQSSVSSYINSLDPTISDIDYIAKFIQGASGVYADSDISWARKMDKMDVEFGVDKNVI